ncbi:YpsA SLOG family protein [Nitrospira sp. Ecomares 2.1]
MEVWLGAGRKPVTEMTSPEYFSRTQANVIDPDATIIFTYGLSAGGSLKIAMEVHHPEKPYHHVDLKKTTRKQTVDEIVR